jgi:hypothetical protein
VASPPPEQASAPIAREAVKKDIANRRKRGFVFIEIKIRSRATDWQSACFADVTFDLLESGRSSSVGSAAFALGRLVSGERRSEQPEHKTPPLRYLDELTRLLEYLTKIAEGT